MDANGDSIVDESGTFIYDGDQILLVLDETGNVDHRLLWGAAVDQILADENSSGDVNWMLTDHQNTVRDIVQYDETTDTTAVVNHLAYDAFGNVASETDPAVDVFNLQYTARYFDEATGLQYNSYRWYDAAVGRWMSQDPIGFTAGDGNLYRYVGNDVLTQTDPSGLQEYDVLLPSAGGGFQSVPIPEELWGLYDSFRSELRSHGPYGPLTAEQNALLNRHALGAAMDFRYFEAEQRQRAWDNTYGTNDQAWTTAPAHSAAWTHTRNFMWSGRDRVLGYGEVLTCDYWKQVGQFAGGVYEGKIKLEPALRHGVRESNQQFLDNPDAAFGALTADGGASLAIGGTLGSIVKRVRASQGTQAAFDASQETWSKLPRETRSMMHGVNNGSRPLTDFTRLPADQQKAILDYYRTTAANASKANAEAVRQLNQHRIEYLTELCPDPPGGIGNFPKPGGN